MNPSLITPSPRFSYSSHTLRATPYQANRTLGVLSKMFSLADMSSGLALEI